MTVALTRIFFSLILCCAVLHPAVGGDAPSEIPPEELVSIALDGTAAEDIIEAAWGYIATAFPETAGQARLPAALRVVYDERFPEPLLVVCCPIGGDYYHTAVSVGLFELKYLIKM